MTVCSNQPPKISSQNMWNDFTAMKILWRPYYQCYLQSENADTKKKKKTVTKREKKSQSMFYMLSSCPHYKKFLWWTKSNQEKYTWKTIDASQRDWGRVRETAGKIKSIINMKIQNKWQRSQENGLREGVSNSDNRTETI